MKKRHILIAFLLVITAPASFGREWGSSRHAAGISWGISTPVGKDNFMNKQSWISPALSYEYQLTHRFSLAASLGYEYGKERGVTSDRLHNDLLDGYTTRTLTSIPVQARVLYFFRRNRELPFQPYLGAGIGVNYARFYVEGDLISPVGKSNWAGIFTAQAGFRYALGGGPVSLDASLFWQRAGNAFAPVHIERRQSAGVRIGVIFGF